MRSIRLFPATEVRQGPRPWQDIRWQERRNGSEATERSQNYLVSFIGYAPAYDPQVLVYVVLDTPNLPGEEQAHSRFASEISAKNHGGNPSVYECIPGYGNRSAGETKIWREEKRASHPATLQRARKDREGAGEGGRIRGPDGDLGVI